MSKWEAFDVEYFCASSGDMRCMACAFGGSAISRAGQAMIVPNLSNVEPTGIISASTNFSEGRMEEKGELDHYIGVATSSDETAEFDVLKVEDSTWAVFD